MSKISREQALEVMAKLGTNTDWSQLDSEVIQRIIKDPTGSGREFTRFLANGGRITTTMYHLIDCDADPFVPIGWAVNSHKKSGQLAFDPIKIRFHLSPNQQDGKYIKGNELRKELANESTLNANVLDYLLKNPRLIPEEWKNKDVGGNTRYIFFWGTIYRYSNRYSNGDLCVRCLSFDGGGWHWYYHWLDGDWFGGSPAAVLAS